MKNFLQTSRKVIALFLVWMLTQLSPVQEYRVFSWGAISTAAAAADERLADCKDYTPPEEGNNDAGGIKCKINTVDIEDGDAWMISEGYVSILITWGVALIFMFQVIRCTSVAICGYSTIASALGAAALLGGEIASIVGFAMNVGKLKYKIEYRHDQVSKVKDGCATGGGSGSGAIGDISACDQREYLKAQKDALESAKTAATWKFALALAAGSAFAIAAIIEAVGYFKDIAEDTAIETAAVGAIPAIETAGAGCAVPPATTAVCETQIQALTAKLAVVEGEVATLKAKMSDPTPAPSIVERTGYIAYVTQLALAFKLVYGIASAGPAAPYVLPALFVLTLLEAKVVTFNQPNTVLAGDPAPASNIGSLPSPEEYYNPTRRTCERGPSEVLRWPSGQMYQGYGALSLNHYLEVTKFAGIFFHQTPSDVSYLINEEEVQREITQAQTEIDLKGEQEKLSLNDYRKLRQFYGDEILSDHQFDFLNIILDKAVAIENKSEDSGLVLNQIITNSIGLAGAGVLVLMGILKATSVAADGAFSTPAKRFWWNMLASGLAFTQATYTKLAVIDILSEQIGRIDSILKLVDSSTTGAQSPGDTSVPYSSSVLVDDSFFETPPPLPGNQTYPCPAGGDGKGGCKDVGNSLDSTLATLDLSSLTGLGGSLKSLNSGMAGKKTMGQGTLTNATILASAARGLKKKIRDLQKKFNKDREKNKKPPIDFAGTQTKTLKSLFKKANDLLAAKGVTAASLMPASPVEPVSQKDLEKKLAENLANGNKVAAAAVPAGNGLDGLNFGSIEEDKGAASLDAGGGNTLAKNLDDSYEVPNNDIASDANADIFQMLSSRYLKTAYPIFFEEEKAPAKAP